MRGRNLQSGYGTLPSLAEIIHSYFKFIQRAYNLQYDHGACFPTLPLHFPHYKIKRSTNVEECIRLLEESLKIALLYKNFHPMGLLVTMLLGTVLDNSQNNITKSNWRKYSILPILFQNLFLNATFDI